MSLFPNFTTAVTKYLLAGFLLINYEFNNALLSGIDSKIKQQTYALKIQYFKTAFFEILIIHKYRKIQC